MVPVCVVDLKLYEIHILMCLEKFLKQLRIAVEGETVILNESLLFKFLNIVPDVELVVFLIVAPLQRVQQIVVDITRAGPLKRCSKFSLCGFLVLNHIVAHQFACKGVAVPRIALDQSLLDGLFRSRISKCGVEICAARFHEQIDHVRGLRNINASVFQFRKPHKSESQFKHALTSLSVNDAVPFRSY